MSEGHVQSLTSLIERVSAKAAAESVELQEAKAREEHWYRKYKAADAKLNKLWGLVERISQWDQLNPPAPQSDLPWLKKLVEEAWSVLRGAADPPPGE
jgi:hypothetical protein